MEPKLDFEGGDDGVKSVLDGKSDFAWTVSVEVLPAFEIGDVAGIKIEKPVADVDDALGADVARESRPAQCHLWREDGRRQAAEERSRPRRLHGKIDGEPFEGGTGTDISVDLGSELLHSGLRGPAHRRQGRAIAKTIEVTFPGNYLAKNLAGKAATFDVTVKSVQAPGELAIDDELAKSVGMESLDKLKDAIRDIDRPRSGRGVAPQGEAAASGRSRREIFVRPAADLARAGVHQCLARRSRTT